MKNVSNQSKALVLLFPVIGQCLLWKVENGEQIGLGSDAMLRCGKVFWPEDLTVFLGDRGFMYLNHVSNPDAIIIWSKGWKQAHNLELVQIHVDLWRSFVETLQKDHVQLREKPNTLAWAYSNSGDYYSARLGYKQQFPTNPYGRVSWWKEIWKKQELKKIHIFLWLALKNKVLTWAAVQRRGRQHILLH